MRLERSQRWDRIKERFEGFPFSVWIWAILLGAIGVVFIHSATFRIESRIGMAPKQALVLAILPGIAGLLAFAKRRRVLDLAWPLFFLALLTLVVLLFYGTTINGARRWFRLGGLSIQPSEFVKPVMILVLARYLRFEVGGRLWKGILMPLGLTLVPMVLMIRQPDLGSALALLPVTFAMAFVAGARGRTLIALALIGFLFLVLLFPFLHDYQKERVQVWLSQWLHSDGLKKLGAGYHLHQSQIAVGSGGLFGDGLFRGVQSRYDFLPYRSTDFLFSVIAEETGFLGSTLLILLYTGFCAWIFKLGASIRDRFGRLLAVGVGTYFLTHLWIHVGVTTGLLPTTGLPLPLLSFGRSSVSAAWLALGLLGHALVQRERNLSRDRYL